MEPRQPLGRLRVLQERPQLPRVSRWIFVPHVLSHPWSCGGEGAAGFLEERRSRSPVEPQGPAPVRRFLGDRNQLRAPVRVISRVPREPLPRRNMRAAEALAPARRVSALSFSCDALSGRSSIYACRACNIRTPLRAIGALSHCAARDYALFANSAGSERAGCSQSSRSRGLR
jgi:hypothetical protein